MIGYLKGKVLKIYTDYAIVVVGGVGYEVYCSGSAFSKMTEGAEVELYTYMQVSEANGISLDAENPEVVRAGVNVATGVWKYAELLKWIKEKE